jgi:hypothetical protein
MRWRNTDIMVKDPTDPHQSDGVIDYNQGGELVVRQMVKNIFNEMKYIRFNWRQLQRGRNIDA